MAGLVSVMPNVAKTNASTDLQLSVLSSVVSNVSVEAGNIESGPEVGNNVVVAQLVALRTDLREMRLFLDKVARQHEERKSGIFKSMHHIRARTHKFYCSCLLSLPLSNFPLSNFFFFFLFHSHV